MSVIDEYLVLSNVRCHRSYRCCQEFISRWENFLTVASPLQMLTFSKARLSVLTTNDAIKLFIFLDKVLNFASE